MDKKFRKDYVCTMPFKYTEIAEKGQWLCCPSWLPTNIKDSEDLKGNWFSSKSNGIRESILDGSYKYCDAVQCPYLASLDAGKPSWIFIRKEDSLSSSIIQNPKPRVITFGWDASCNLQCPSCRLNFVNLKGKSRDKVNATIDLVSDTMGEYIEEITLCGAGDPFFSKSYVNFMKNFDRAKFPKLNGIHLHTNAILWTEKLWNAIPNVHKYIRSCEISIDAATKDTYENKVRLRGDWDVLMSNLKFISTIPTLDMIRFSFVTQKRNYNEMKMFYEMITNLMHGKNKGYEIIFNGITDWGAYPTKEDFLKEEVHKPHHPEYPLFVEKLKEVVNLNIIHNFHHILTKERAIL